MRTEYDNKYGIVVRFESDDIYEIWLINAEYLANISKIFNENQTWG